MSIFDSTSPYLHPFPTRRSSDLLLGHDKKPFERRAGIELVLADVGEDRVDLSRVEPDEGQSKSQRRFLIERGQPAHPLRSEEHTSELQSPCNIVCRLLLEKKTRR